MHSAISARSNTSAASAAQGSPEPADPPTSLFERIELTKGALGLGIHIAGGADAPLEGAGGAAACSNVARGGGCLPHHGDAVVGSCVRMTLTPGPLTATHPFPAPRASCCGMRTSTAAAMLARPSGWCA